MTLSPRMTKQPSNVMLTNAFSFSSSRSETRISVIFMDPPPPGCVRTALPTGGRSAAPCLRTPPSQCAHNPCEPRPLRASPPTGCGTPLLRFESIVTNGPTVGSVSPNPTPTDPSAPSQRHSYRSPSRAQRSNRENVTLQARALLQVPSPARPAPDRCEALSNPPAGDLPKSYRT